MRKKLIFSGLFVVLLLTGVYMYRTLLAQTTPPALIVHPSNLDLSLNLGQPKIGVIYLMNTTKNPVTIQTRLENFTAQGEEGGVALTQQNTPFSLASWIKVSPEKVAVPAGKEVAFTYTITPPTNAEPGGHFGSIVFATVPNTTINGAGSAISEEVASLILARIPGNVKEEAKVVSFSSDKTFYEFGPVTFTIRVQNMGDIHIQPFGAVQITDMLGHKYDAPIQATNVLPGAIRRITAVLPNKLLIGQYTATLIASYGDKNLSLNAGYLSFYGFPLRYGAVVLVALILLFLLRKRLAKAFKAIATGK